ncbi:uncharacterized protein LOC119012971 [Acanthopagrus latus]|uniref:uncharacterized protein LOC119012971 n=1 Tax=Acanthopagrus latus TaxID=8177 RepID=UPI00187C26F0|nr:uncharacterized protein LOC119012971 [Acanthopagrus latus]
MDHEWRCQDKLFLPRIVGHLSPETGNHFILWVFDFKLRQIRVYDSLMLQCQISHGDMDLLRNVFRLSGGLEGWTVTFPSQWKQQDTVNCGVFVCSAAENEALNREVTAEALTLNQCRTLRLHHAAQILKTVNAEDFPRTAEELLKMEKKEIKLQEAEAKKPNSNSHCLAWKLRSCLFQRATGTTSVFHEKIKMYPWVQCTACKNWLHFQCAGVEGDWTSKDFFCGCNSTPKLDDILESVKAEDILTDGEIKDLERNLQSGNILSNRMYLWEHRGLDPALRKHYSEHFTLFNDMKTDDIIQRLDKVLSVPGTVAEKQLFLTDIILPEVLILWLQKSHSMSRYQAESVLLKSTSSKDDKRPGEITEGDSESMNESDVILRDCVAAADWCRKAKFDGGLSLSYRVKARHSSVQD